MDHTIKKEKQAYKSNPDIKLEMSKYNVELKPLAEKYVEGFYNITKDTELITCNQIRNDIKKVKQ